MPHESRATRACALLASTCIAITFFSALACSSSDPDANPAAVAGAAGASGTTGKPSATGSAGAAGSDLTSTVAGCSDIGSTAGFSLHFDSLIHETRYPPQTDGTLAYLMDGEMHVSCGGGTQVDLTF